jgi:hypothetical protein
LIRLIDRSKFKKQKEKEEKFKIVAKKNLKTKFGTLFILKDPKQIEDLKHATDLVAQYKYDKDMCFRISLRSRSVPFDKFKDITIRSKVPQGKTEIDKIQKGFSDLYVYGWEDGKDWIIFDVNGLRKYKLLDIDRKEVSSNNNKFISIKVHELYYHDLIIDASKTVLKYLKTL